VDSVSKINRKYKVQKRIMLLTENGIYNLKPGKLTFNRRIAIKDIGGVSLSSRADNYFVIHVPKEYDYLFIVDTKTEFITALADQFQAINNQPLPLNFKDEFNYKIKRGTMYSLKFVDDKKQEGCNHAVDSKDKKKLIITIGNIDVVNNAYLDKVKPVTMNPNSKPKKQEWQLPPGAKSRGISITSSNKSPPNKPLPVTPKQVCAKGLYDFKANDNRELSFKKGDKMRIISQEEDGWWSAEINGKLGFVPSTYVEVMDERVRSQSRNVPLPAKPK